MTSIARARARACRGELRFAEDGPPPADELRRRLAEGSPVWAWIEAPPSEASFLRTGDAVEVVPATTGGPLHVVDDEGRAAIDVRAGDAAIGSVRQIWRRGVRIRLDRLPWSALVRAGDVRSFRAFERVAQAAHRATQAANQLRRTPRPSEAERDEARTYATKTILRAYEGMAQDGLSETEVAIATRHFRPGMRVLDVGCGTGREALGFAQRGLSVVGIDVCAASIAHAKSAAAAAAKGDEATVDVQFATMPLSAPDFPDGSFDAVFISSDVYSCVPTRAARVAALVRCRRLVRPSGLVVIPAMVGQSPLGRLFIDAPRRLARRLFGERVAEPGDRWVPLDPEGATPLAFRHRFVSAAEVRSELALAGLPVVDRISSYWITRAPVFRYRAHEEVVARPREADLVLVGLSKGEVFALNATARAIWDRAQNGATLAEIVAHVQRSGGGAPLASLERDVAEALEEMVANALVVRESTEQAS